MAVEKGCFQKLASPLSSFICSKCYNIFSIGTTEVLEAPKLAVVFHGSGKTVSERSARPVLEPEVSHCVVSGLVPRIIPIALAQEGMHAFFWILDYFFLFIQADERFRRACRRG